jgi:hypothetical protein
VRARPAFASAALAGAIFTLAACAQAVNGSGSGRYHATAAAGTHAPSSPPATRGLPSSASSGPSSSGPSAPSSAPASSGGGGRPVPAHPVRQRTVQGSDGTVYQVKVWAEVTGEKDCAAQAYGGPVIAFLNAHPCVSMNRLLATTTVNGRQVGFAERSIGFTGSNAGQAYRTAGKFRKLVSRNGTGNIDDLMRDGYRLPSGPKSVPFPNAFSALSQDSGVTIVEAWYVDGSTSDNDPALERMEQAIYLQV